LSQQNWQQLQMISTGGAQSAAMSPPDTNLGQKLLPTMGMVPLNALK
jgi:hypothetical protein